MKYLNNLAVYNVSMKKDILSIAYRPYELRCIVSVLTMDKLTIRLRKIYISLLQICGSDQSFYSHLHVIGQPPCVDKLRRMQYS